MRPYAGLTLNVVVACLTTIGILCSESASEVQAQDKELILRERRFVWVTTWASFSGRRNPSVVLLNHGSFMRPHCPPTLTVMKSGCTNSF